MLKRILLATLLLFTNAASASTYEYAEFSEYWKWVDSGASMFVKVTYKSPNMSVWRTAVEPDYQLSHKAAYEKLLEVVGFEVVKSYSSLNFINDMAASGWEVFSYNKRDAAEPGGIIAEETNVLFRRLVED